MLVIDQGTLLDSVEYNIEQTAVRVGDAVKELQEATRWAILGFLFIPRYVLCVQVSKEHRTEAMHFPAAADHIRAHHSAYIQAEVARVFITATS